MKKPILFVIMILLFITSCSSDKSNSNLLQEDTAGEKLFDCLASFSNDYSLLLSKEEMNSIYPFPKDEVELRNKSGRYGSLKLLWPSDRGEIHLEIAGRGVAYEDKNFMEIGQISFYDKEQGLESVMDLFDRGYRPMSQKEIDRIKERLKKSDNEDVRNMGGDLMNTRSQMKWQKVEGVGTSAWYEWRENNGIEMVVLAGFSKFQINVRISMDEAENLAIAKKMALLALSKC